MKEEEVEEVGHTREIPDDGPKINDFIEQVAGDDKWRGDCL